MRVLAAVAAICVFAASCGLGGGDDQDATTDTGPSPTTTDAGVTSSTIDTDPPVAAVAWSTCDEEFECGTVTVPLDHSNPSGPTIDIALVRARAFDPDERIGSLLLNPGGPGASGVEFTKIVAGLFDREVAERFDIVGFDPRGTGQSATIDCIDSLDDEINVPDTADGAQLDAALAADEELAARCVAEHGDVIPYVGTNNAARDMDLIRQALGDDKLTYVGFSYGTSLGTVYAGLYPDKVRAMVLDGAISPTSSQEDQIKDQFKGFDDAFLAFAADCDADPTCPLSGVGTAAVFADIEERVELADLPAGDGRALTLGEYYFSIASALYSADSWPILAAGLESAYVDGDATTLQALTDFYFERESDGTYSNTQEANIAINCADDAARPSVADAVAFGREVAEDLEFFDRMGLSAGLGCLSWPAAIDPIDIRPVVDTPPILVVGSTGDPATPYEGAVDLAAFIESGVLVTYEGEGHTAYLSVSCIDDIVNPYLLDLEVPTGQPRCP